jgi:lysophosphatidic acid acyltransferase/lysophosphatidylinositol acyltransferase
MLNAILSYFKTLIPIHVILLYVFLTSGLFVNFLQLLTLFIWPFNKQLYRKINCNLAYLFWSSNYSNEKKKIYYYLHIIK